MSAFRSVGFEAALEDGRHVPVEAGMLQNSARRERGLGRNAAQRNGNRPLADLPWTLADCADEFDVDSPGH
jgi:hypothetical protein